MADKRITFARLLVLFEDTPAHDTLQEMEAELGAQRAWDLVVMLIVQADQIATLWQSTVQKEN